MTMFSKRIPCNHVKVLAHNNCASGYGESVNRSGINGEDLMNAIATAVEHLELDWEAPLTLEELNIILTFDYDT